MKWGSPNNYAARALNQLYSFKLADWLFVACAYLTVAYLIFGLIESSNPDRLQETFDFMPIAVGAPAILMGWRAVRLKENIREAMSSLQAGAGLDVPDGASLKAMMADLQRQIRGWSWGFGIVIMVLCFVGFYYIVGAQLIQDYTQLQDSKQQAEPSGLNGAMLQGVFLGAVMTGAGLFIGWLLGGLIGYGRLFQVMDRHNVQLASVATKASGDAMRSVEEAFEYSFQATGLLCLWFAVWWTAWRFGFPQYRELYASFFLTLWVVSVFLLITTAWIPARLLNKRLDKLLGGQEGEAANRAQRNLAEDDLKKVTHQNSLLARELRSFIATLSVTQRRSAWLDLRLINAAVIANAVLFLVPWYFGTL